MLRRITGCSVATLALGCGSALAQGAPGFSWSGFYGGVGIGYGEHSTRYRETGSPTIFVPGTSHMSAKGSGVSLSAFVGYNFLVSPLIVLGVEADAATLPGRAKVSKAAGAGSFDVAEGAGLAASLRGRAGLAFDRALLFASVGVATSDLESRGQWSLSPTWKFDRKAGTGLVLGLGADYALTNNLLIRVDGSFYDFGSGATANQTAIPGYAFRGSQDAFTLRAGLAYKL